MRYAPRRQGFTILEIMISLTLLAVVMGGAITATQRGTDAFRRSSANTALDARAARGLDRVTRELVGAGTGTLIPDPQGPFGSETLDFQTASGFVGPNITWGTTVRVRWELAAGEADNDLDDNGDGLVDEGSVVRILDPGQPGEQRVVLARNVSEFFAGELDNGADDNGNGLIDERGLSFELDDDTLHVRLSVEQIGPDGELMIRSLETSVTLRN